uniref:Uncharacterized protein n=1 Tax=Oryza alta TaxID=52545 RepID=A0A1V1H3P2_9ORYZ|nr:hypothetical protein [Oryza alta]BAX25061.1 hypothetical protein [Oryza alta]
MPHPYQTRSSLDKLPLMCPTESSKNLAADNLHRPTLTPKLIPLPSRYRLESARGSFARAYVIRGSPLVRAYVIPGLRTSFASGASVSSGIASFDPRGSRGSGRW